MTRFFILFLCFLFTAALSAQPTIQWQKALGGYNLDEGRSVQQTSDGGYILVGNVRSNNGDVSGNHGDNDYWVVKLDPWGAIQWKKTLGGTGTDWPNSIRQTNDKGYIIAGYSSSEDGDVTDNHGDYDAWVVKLDSSGAIEWKRSYGGSDWDEAQSIQQTSDGGYIFAGLAQSIDGDVSGGVYGDLDCWVVKLNNQGAIEWQKTLGGSLQDIAHSIKQTADGGYVVAGEAWSFDGDVSGNNGTIDFWVVKLNNSGVIEWQNALGGTGADAAEDVIQDVDGSYIVTGVTGSHNTGDVSGHSALGSFDCWVVKLSSTGQLIWQKAFGGTKQDYAESIVPSGDGGYVVTGSTASTNGDVVGHDGGTDIWVVKLDVQGNLVWQKTYGGSKGDDSFCISKTSDNGFVVVGYTWSNDGDVSGWHNFSDIWVVKLSPESVGIPTIPAAAQPDIFPNPAGEYFSLQTTGGESSLEVKLLDMLGREVGNQAISNGGKVAISTLPKGLYLIQAVGDSGKRYTGKIRKE